MKSILFSLFIIFLIWVYLFVTTGRIPSFKIPYINPKKTKSTSSDSSSSSSSSGAD